MEIGLVLQGGGALGAYEWGAVTRLVEVGMQPVAIAGVSIGAINAAAIAGARDGDIAMSLEKLWTAITLPEVPFLPPKMQVDLSLFGNPAFYEPRRDYWTMQSWQSFYSVAPMYDTLNRIVDWKRLNDSRIHKVSVTATRIEDGRAVRFTNLEKTLDARHVLASGSLPPGFPMTEIDGAHYVDGGVFSNTPLPGMLKLLDESQLDDLHIFIIDLFPREGIVPKNLLEVQNRVKEITYENRIEADFGGIEGMHEFGRMARMLYDHMRAHESEDPALDANTAARFWLRQRALTNLHVIEAPHAPTSGDRDFSHAGIRLRRKTGYAAAQGWLDAHRDKLDRAIVRKMDQAAPAA